MSDLIERVRAILEKKWLLDTGAEIFPLSDTERNTLTEAIEALTRLQAERDEALKEATRERYIGVPCPVCGRIRLIYKPGERHAIECEKCGADSHAIHDADPLARAETAEKHLALADDLLRRLDEWDQMNVTGGDGPFWKREIARVRSQIGEDTE